jgi:predicted phage tail protein
MAADGEGALRVYRAAIRGSGGGTEEQRSPVEAPNSLQAKSIALIVDLLGEGPNVGIVDPATGLPGTGDDFHKGILYADAPLKNTDGTYNFPGTVIYERIGDPDQAHIPEFPAGETPNGGVFPVQVIQATPIVRRITATAVNRARVGIRIPSLSLSNATTGDITGNRVIIKIEVKAAATTGGSEYVQRVYDVIDAKSSGPYERAYGIALTGAAPWDIRVTRVSPDDASVASQSQTYWQYLTEIVDTRINYADRHVVAQVIDAQQTGGAIPQRNFIVKGRIVRVPSNYNAATRTYTGEWDGLFVDAWTNNPAWVVFDLLTHERYGLGADITDDDIEIWDFYQAAQYCDGWRARGVEGVSGKTNDYHATTGAHGVPDGNGGFEPRFTFNGTFSQQQDAVAAIQSIAGMFRSALIWGGEKFSLMTNRPKSVSKIFTRANVKNGKFAYQGTALGARHTVALVDWINPDLNFEPDVMPVQLSDSVQRYGYNELKLNAVGCTSPGQAYRQGLAALLTEWLETDSVSFECGITDASITLGSVVGIADPIFTTQRRGGRLLAVASATSVTLDSSFTFDVARTYTLKVMLPNGVLGSYAVTNPGAAASTITIAALPSAPDRPTAGAVWALHDDLVETRQFYVMSLTEQEDQWIKVFAIEYDPDKFAQIDGGVVLPDNGTSFSDLTVNAVSAVDEAGFNLTYNSKNIGNGTVGQVIASWQQVQGAIRGYSLTYQYGYGPILELPETKANSYTFDNLERTRLTVWIRAINQFGVPSPAVVKTIDLDTSTATGKALISGLQIQGGGTAWSGRDINIEWTAKPSTLDTLSATGITTGFDQEFKQFRIRVYTTNGGVLLGTLTSAETKITVSYDQLSAWSVAASQAMRRSYYVAVELQDLAGTYSAVGGATFTNPAPALPTITEIQGSGSVQINFSDPTDPDYIGIRVWASDTAGFTPGSGNLVWEGAGNPILFGVPSATVYYRVEPYDAFGNTSLNRSSELSAVFGAAGAGGVTAVGTLPGSGTLNEIVYLTTENKLYSYNGSAWIAVTSGGSVGGVIGVETGATLPGTGNFAGRLFFLTTDTTLYRHSGTPSGAGGWTAQVAGSLISDDSLTAAKFATTARPIEVLSSLPATGNFEGRMVFLTTNDKLYRHAGSPTDASGFSSATAAADVTGTLTNSQIADLAASKITGTITDTQIAAGAISAAKFASGLTPVEVLSTLPGAGNFEGRTVYLTTDDKLYRHNGTSFISAVAAVDVTGTLTNAQIADLAATKITGQIVSSQITDAAITVTKFASGLTPVEVLASLPGAGNFEGRTVYLTTDDKLYRYNGSAFISATAAADITGQLATAQIATGAINATLIASGAVGSTQLATGAVIAGKITAGTIVAADIAANTITAAKIAVGTITANELAANTITAAKIAANTITAGQIAAGTLTATTIAARAITADKLLVVGASLWPDPGFKSPAMYAVGQHNGSTFDWFNAGTLTGTGPHGWYFEQNNQVGVDSYIALWSGRAGQDNTKRFYCYGPHPSGYGINDLMPCTPGRVYEVALTGQNNSNQLCYVVVEFFTAANVYVSALNPITLPSGGASTNANFRGQFTAPATTAGMRLQFTNAGGSTLAGSMVVGNVTVREAASGTMIVDGSISAGKITANTITAGQLAAGTITANEIAANTITAAKIAVGTITANEIAANTITAAKIAANTITAGQIAAGTITATQIAAGTISSDRLMSGGRANLLYGSDGWGSDLSSWFVQGWNPDSKTYTGPSYQVTGDNTWNYLGEPRGTVGIRQNDGTTGTWGFTDWYFVRRTTTGTQNQWYNARPGLAYTFAITHAGHRTRHAFNLYFVDASFAVVGDSGTGWITPGSGGEAAVEGSGWTRSFVSAVAPAGTKYVLVYFRREHTTQGFGYTDSYSWFTRAGLWETTAVMTSAPAWEPPGLTLIQGGNIVTDSITASQIAAGAITAAEIAANTITAAQIAAGTITATQIAAGTITADKLVANSITAGQIAAGTITAAQIAANTITASKLILTNSTDVFPDTTITDPVYHSGGALTAFTGVFGGASHADGVANQPRRSFSVSGNLHYYATNQINMEGGSTYRVKLRLYRPSGVTGHYCSFMHIPGVALILPGNNTTNPNEVSWPGINVASYAADTWHTFTQTVVSSTAYNYTQMYHSHSLSGGSMYAQWEVVRASSADLIVDGAITAAKIQAGTITANEIAGGTITAAKIAGGTITATQIAGGTITGDKLVAGTITAAQIAAGTITADRMSVTSLSALSANLGTITAGVIDVSGGLTIRSASSGTRIEITNSRIEVYNGSTLRVRMGIW